MTTTTQWSIHQSDRSAYAFRYIAILTISGLLYQPWRPKHACGGGVGRSRLGVGGRGRGGTGVEARCTPSTDVEGGGERGRRFTSMAREDHGRQNIPRGKNIPSTVRRRRPEGRLGSMAVEATSISGSGALTREGSAVRARRTTTTTTITATTQVATNPPRTSCTRGSEIVGRLAGDNERGALFFGSTRPGPEVGMDKQGWAGALSLRPEIDGA